MSGHKHQWQAQIWQTLVELQSGMHGDKYSFPPTLNNLERKFVHEVARKLDIKSKSSGKGTNRFITVYRVEESAQAAKREPSSRESLALDPKTLNMLTQYLQDCPADEAAMAESAARATTMRRVKAWKNRYQASAPPSAQQAAAEGQRMKAQLAQQKQSKAYQSMLRTRARLPAYERKEEIMRVVRENQVVVLSGSTGCGKSTQVPQFLLEDCVERGLGATTSIVCTQPRRISATAVAERIAAERGTPIGSEVGYQIRLDAKKSSQTKMLFCTVGILLRRLITDKRLSTVTHIIVDEVHERDRLTDFLLIIIRDLLPARPDLKVILMSATINADLFADYFRVRGYTAPLVHVPGFTHSVTAVFLEDIIEQTGYMADEPSTGPLSRKQRSIQNTGRAYKGEGTRATAKDVIAKWAAKYGDRYSDRTVECLARLHEEVRIDHDLVAAVVEHICGISAPEGAILIFCPGWDDITKVIESLECSPLLRDRSRFRLLPLHSTIPSHEQRKIFERPPRGVRKVVVATNIAETSITIDDVVHVVDVGLMKEKCYDPYTKMSTLLSQTISKANAKQRSGRAGRVQAGVCYRLYTKEAFEAMADFPVAEMLRTPLEELILAVKMLAPGPAVDFLNKAVQPPDLKSVDEALLLLGRIGAIELESESLTVLGEHLAALPMEPRLGKMILYGSVLQCLDPILTVAAFMAYRDPFAMALPHERARAEGAKSRLAGGSFSDQVASLRAFEEWQQAKQRGRGAENAFCRNNFINGATMNMVNAMRRQFFKLLKRSGMINRDTPSPSAVAVNRYARSWSLVKAVLCGALYPNLCRVNYRLRKGGGAGKMILSTRDALSGVQIHPGSVNARVNKLPGSYVGFHEAVRSSNIFLRGTSVIPPLALVLFGGGPEGSRVTEGTAQDAFLHEGRVMAQNVVKEEWVKAEAEEANERGPEALSGVASNGIGDDGFAHYDDPEAAVEDFGTFAELSDSDSDSSSSEGEEKGEGEQGDGDGDDDDDDSYHGVEGEPVVVDGFEGAVGDVDVDVDIDDDDQDRIAYPGDDDYIDEETLAEGREGEAADEEVALPSGVQILHVDDWVSFTGHEDTVAPLQSIRLRIDHLLRQSIASTVERGRDTYYDTQKRGRRRKGSMDRADVVADGDLLDVVVGLLTAEDTSLRGADRNESIQAAQGMGYSYGTRGGRNGGGGGRGGRKGGQRGGKGRAGGQNRSRRGGGKGGAGGKGKGGGRNAGRGGRGGRRRGRQQ